MRREKGEWSAYKRKRFESSALRDEAWQKPVLPQPAAIKVVADFAKEIDAAKFFDAGDVQANGFQIVEDDRTGDTFTEAGASYMGFAASALLATALADNPRYGIAFSGDGSFMMNPQVLIDAVEHGVRGMIVIFDNRRMAAITGLQLAQYKAEFRTNDHVAVDYEKLASSVSGVLAVSGGNSAAYASNGFENRSRASGPFHCPCAGLLRSGRAGWSWRLGRMERRQLVRGRAGRLAQAGALAEPGLSQHSCLSGGFRVRAAEARCARQRPNAPAARSTSMQRKSCREKVADDLA